MKKQLLERYINQVLVESKKNNSIKMAHYHLSQDKTNVKSLENQIYEYLRSSNQDIIYYHDKDSTNIVDAIKKAKPNIVNDLKEYCSGYKVVDKLREAIGKAKISVKEIDFNPPWLYINLEESVLSNKSVTYSDPKTEQHIASAARHNLYFTIKDTNITDKDSLINNIESYWKKDMQLWQI